MCNDTEERSNEQRLELCMLGTLPPRTEYALGRVCADNTVPIAVGVAVGGVVLLALIIVGVFVVRGKGGAKKEKKDAKKKEKKKGKKGTAVVRSGAQAAAMQTATVPSRQTERGGGWAGSS